MGAEGTEVRGGVGVGGVSYRGGGGFFFRGGREGGGGAIWGGY